MVSLVNVVIPRQCLKGMDRGQHGRGLGMLTEQLASVKSSRNAEFLKHGLGLALEHAPFDCVP
jgi:hypothetical protein